MQKELILPYFDLKEAKRILSPRPSCNCQPKAGDANMLDDARMGEFVRQEVI